MLSPIRPVLDTCVARAAAALNVVACVSSGDGGAKEIVASRHNDGARHEEGIKHITPELRNVARDANSVDFALHEFVSAKFCDRLEEMGVLDHPLVVAELAGYDTLNQR